MLPLLEIVFQILKGFVFGALASVVGYLKQESVPKWDLSKLVKTMVIGAIIAAIFAGSGLDVAGAAVALSNYLGTQGIPIAALELEGIISTAIVILADEVVKIVVRRTEIVDLWNKIKAWFSAFEAKRKEVKLEAEKAKLLPTTAVPVLNVEVEPKVPPTVPPPEPKTDTPAPA